MNVRALVPCVLFGLFGTNACAGDEVSSEVPFKGWTPECSASETAKGTWTAILPPEGVLGIANLAPRHKFSDGETFTVVRDRSIAFLGPGETEWSTDAADRAPGITGWVWAASPDFLVIQGGQTEDFERDNTNSAEIFNLSQSTWQLVPGSNSPLTPTFATGAFLRGSEFLLVYRGGYPDGGGKYITASTLDATTGNWGSLPEVEVGVSADTDEPTNGTLDADMVGDDLVVWGILPDESSAFGVRWSGESWSKLSMGDSPSVRRYADVVGANDGFYVVGGIHPDSDGTWDWFGEIWFYSLAADEWSQIDVPNYVDPKKGAWLNGKLYVFGDCNSDAVYDPLAETWELLPELVIPDYGLPMVAGGRIFLTEVTDPHGDDTPEIYIYDPSGPSGVGGAEPM